MLRAYRLGILAIVNLLALSIVSCGSNLSHTSESNSDLYVKIVDDLSTIYVGANNASSLKFCLASEKCDPEDDADEVKKQDGITIFKLSNENKFNYLSLQSFDSDGTQLATRFLHFTTKSITGVSKWNALLVSGDASISAFDNAVSKMSSILQGKGQISDPKKMLARSGANRATVSSIQDNLIQNADNTDGCFLFMTSHGSKGMGFYLNTTTTQYLTPIKLASMLDIACMNKPTIILVSACYSGFFSDTQALRRDNVAILTAAASDRTSFGCGVENQYTYWDSCLVDNYEKSLTIDDLSQNILSCIKTKENASYTNFSNPQTFIGEKMKGFVLP